MQRISLIEFVSVLVVSGALIFGITRIFQANYWAKKSGGSQTIILEKNQETVNVTWDGPIPHQLNRSGYSRCTLGQSFGGIT